MPASNLPVPPIPPGRGQDNQTSLHANRAVDGFEESLAWIVERYTPLLRVQATHRMPRALQRVCDPEDLLNDVWASVIPRLGNIEIADGSMAKVLLKYLSTALLNRINGLSRKLARGEPVRLEWRAEDGSEISGLDHLPMDTTGIVSRVLRTESSNALHQALESLSELDREVLVLRGIEQRPYDEVAEITGQSENALSKRFQRGLEKLKRRLPESLLANLE